MPKKKSDERSETATLARFERALRNALATPPEKPQALKKRAKKRGRKK